VILVCFVLDCDFLVEYEFVGRGGGYFWGEGGACVLEIDFAGKFDF
jgi:hypothetical protein